jgi:hypothetical protein
MSTEAHNQTSNALAVSSIQDRGFALLAPEELMQVCQVGLPELNALKQSWRELPRDAYLRDGGKYRYRRHSCFVYEPSKSTLEQVPHRAQWQPTDYNALHGGMERWFEPVTAEVTRSTAWTLLLTRLGDLFAAARPVPRWYIEAHQFRIDTAAGIGRPTPEGAHRDGVDFVAVILVDRRAIRGGETRVFEARGIAGVRFTMEEPWTALLLDDERVIHETTPIQPDGPGGARDTLVLTYRARGFQNPPRASEADV